MSLLKITIIISLIFFVIVIDETSSAELEPEPEATRRDTCSNETCGIRHRCFSNRECFSGSKCIRTSITDPFQFMNNSLPFNKYAFLTTHNAFAIHNTRSRTSTPRVTLTNQEDNVTSQLHKGVRGLMLDTYDFEGDVWLCHSFGGQCHDYTAFGPAIDTMKEIGAFLSTNRNEIVTLILEDYVKAPKGLTRVFAASGLMKYWFPIAKMPRTGGDWPSVKDMVAGNHRLLVFTSVKTKEETEGIAYQWNYMLENQYGDKGMKAGACPARENTAPLNDKTKSLVLVNHFKTIPNKRTSCKDNSQELINMLKTCHASANNRWANFVAVDYYMRSEGGGVFEAVDTLNGQMFCGRDDLHSCGVK